MMIYPTFDTVEPFSLSIFDHTIIRKINVVHGGSILNEFFHSGEVVPFLQMLHSLLNNDVIFIVADYLGKLGYIDKIDPQKIHNILHDVAQVVSAQGRNDFMRIDYQFFICDTCLL